ncbi:transglutaminase domain-containing protein [Parabacteroides distasonis]|uniref:transglutaminase domain-containing protein n=2 Tax=Parabacteroides distasonis TaxID=823 RepID=UPI001E5FDC6E|nr:transglutaminase domain-containing protein [Parabacteroides distasonis]MDB9024762.1 transglutaminase domain-containing protein [Parabacteroides distasonis]MDB9041321.1 transglutaminase domain-containing protein [Parabacteroides distasonis]MDB9162387.1 transglutaminase domain-containing protein [Parabacteroides distasonis]
MNKKHLFALLFTLLVWTSCNNQQHFITDAAYRAEVENDFQAKQAALPNGDLFAVFNDQMTPEEREALTFMYAYMPIGDITDYSGDFYLKNIRSSFQARNEMPWGDSIPEDIFRHFVLPVRINNENLDESRMVFFDELKDRVKGLSLYDAVLEVNHWCHEKVIYTPSDGRTSSPLASVKTAYGRCGEESTFTVAALRSVGIPARQVYTPRWAHTDDNHAWVEAWVNGKWYFLGACEPEPVLNLGWFNGPAYRGMLMHTKVFGKYNGPEDVMERTDGYTEINVIDNYAPSAKAVITVTDANGKPVKDALVEFKIYNYAEFNSVARKKTDADGKCSLSAGKGDMLVWASKDGKFGYSKVSFGKDGEVTIALNKKPGDVETIALDIIPPVDGSIPAEVTPEQKEANAKRLLEEDAIRNKYVATFYTEEKAEALAKELGIDPMKTEDFMIGSRGNWMEIEKFLRETPAEKRTQAMALLDVVSAKDLRDTPASVFADHLNNTPAVQSEWLNEYIMNPRVANEFLTPYKSFFAANIEPSLAKQAVENPQALVDWVKNNVSINDALNAQRIPIMPMGVWKSRIADKGSRNIFFVAVARSLGIPARIEPVARKIQYSKDNAWVDVDFEAAVQTTAKQGKVIASYQPIKALQDPKYYSHFTIAKVLPNGTLQTLNFERGGNVDMGLGDTWSGLLKKPLSMDEGNYMLVTGTRMANGSVLAEIEFFNVETDKTTPIQLEMRESKDEIQVIGNFNSENKFKRADNGEETSLLATTGRGYYIVALLGSRQEPTNHAMRDIAAVKKELEDWGRGIVLLFPDEKGYKNFDPKEFGDLPGTITYGLDIDGAIQKEMATAMKLQNANTLPIFLIADTFNRVVFVSQGYTIGLGEQLMKVIHKL